MGVNNMALTEQMLEAIKEYSKDGESGNFQPNRYVAILRAVNAAGTLPEIKTFDDGYIRDAAVGGVWGDGGLSDDEKAIRRKDPDFYGG